MDTAGALLGPLVAFLILRAAADGYDAVFTVSFCVAAVGVLVLLLFVPTPRRPADARDRPNRPRRRPTPSGPSRASAASLRAALGAAAPA